MCGFESPICNLLSTHTPFMYKYSARQIWFPLPPIPVIHFLQLYGVSPAGSPISPSCCSVHLFRIYIQNSSKTYHFPPGEYWVNILTNSRWSRYVLRALQFCISQTLLWWNWRPTFFFRAKSEQKHPPKLSPSKTIHRREFLLCTFHEYFSSLQPWRSTCQIQTQMILCILS